MGIRSLLKYELLDRGIKETEKDAIDKAWLGTDGQNLGFNFNVMADSPAPGLNSIETAGWEPPEVIRIASIPD